MLGTALFLFCLGLVTLGSLMTVKVTVDKQTVLKSTESLIDPENEVPSILKKVDIQERLGEKLDQSLSFTDHTGAHVTLGTYFKDKKPVILTLNYYRCPMLCSLQLNDLVKALKKSAYKLGQDYRMVTMSINPKETYDLGASKREAYLKSLGESRNADWAFLVSATDASKKVADQVGYTYALDPDSGEYAHAPVLFFISADGTVSRYLYGLGYSPYDIKFALQETSAGRAGSTWDKLILSCFQYDASKGRYGVYALGVMRLGGALTVMFLSILLLLLWVGDARPARAVSKDSCKFVG